MTTTAIAGGYAGCQARLGAKVHDPKDPGADLGPMFRQVVGTILRLAAAHPESWLGVRGSHDVPAYGFERFVEPVPLDVDTIRLLSGFHEGSISVADTWRRALEPANATQLLTLAEEAGRLADAASAKLGVGGEDETAHRSTAAMADAMAGFHLPDDLWARIVYDLVIAAKRGDVDLAPLVASFVPVYFAKTASAIVETRHLDTADAEEVVERQARELELAKPYLVERWLALGQADASSVPEPPNARHQAPGPTR